MARRPTVRAIRILAMTLGALTLAACERGCSRATSDPAQSSATASPSLDRPATRLAPLRDAVVTTETATLRATHPRAAAIEVRSPADPASRAALLAEGWGTVAIDKGEAPGTRRPPLSQTRPPAAATTPHRVLRVAHLTDVHLIDDESPSRVADFDGAPPFSGAFRPQEGHSCQTLDAAARTINRMHADDPFDFVLLGGDSIDNAQENELGWLLGVLEGGAVVACDSGRPDDPIVGPSNDPKDPFLPEGLRAPWYWVTGNHDVLVQGNFPVTAETERRATGDRAGGGTRDYARPGAPVVSGAVIADAARRPLTRERLLTRVGDHAPGSYARRTHRAFYTLDVGPRVRLLVVDTAAETGGAEGVLRRDDVEAFVKPELARAVVDGRWVVVAAHHAVDHIGDGTSSGGPRRDDAVSATEWEAMVSAPPVVAVLVGHGHANRVRRVGREPRAVWELQAAALADYPSTFRVVELWEQGDALSLRAVSVDYATADAPLAAEARALSVLDWTTGWSCCGPGAASDRNVILWLPRP